MNFTPFLSTIRKLVILSLSLVYPLLVIFLSQNHDASLVKKYNLTQPKWNRILIHISIRMTCFFCAQAKV